MLATAIANLITFFYPIGNTPAACLTQCLPREKPADILLLGAGDVRNILFTAYSDGVYCGPASDGPHRVAVRPMGGPVGAELTT